MVAAAKADAQAKADSALAAANKPSREWLERKVARYVLVSLFFFFFFFFLSFSLSLSLFALFLNFLNFLN